MNNLACAFFSPFPCFLVILRLKFPMRNRWNTLGMIALGLVFVGISVYLLLHPTRTGVTINYRLGSTQWWGSGPLYDPSTHGFLYMPAAAVLFTPWNLVRPEILGEILWRVVGFGLFAIGLWNLSLTADASSNRGGLTHPRSSTFFLLVLLAVPASLAALSNGQTNLPLSACLVLGVLALRAARWSRAALWFSLALVLKPIALAPWMLAFAVYSAMRIPLLLGIPILAGVGFLHPDPAYALGQWLEFYDKLVRCYTPQTLRVSDLFGAMERAGLIVRPFLEKAIRAVACLGALGYVWRSNRRGGVKAGSWSIWVTSALVFTILNPRAETNGYVLISPLLAFAAISRWREVEGGKWKGMVLAAACIGLMCDGMGKTIYLATDVWFKPLIVLVVSPLLFRMPDGWEGESGWRRGDA